MASLTADHKVLHADLQGDTIRASAGSMVGYRGDIAFKNAGMGGGGGLRAALKQRVAGESVNLMDCTGAAGLKLDVSFAGLPASPWSARAAESRSASASRARGLVYIQPAER